MDTVSFLDIISSFPHVTDFCDTLIQITTSSNKHIQIQITKNTRVTNDNNR